MKVLFRSKDFASVEGAGYGFQNRRPMGSLWQYQGRVRHPQWQGSYQCHWERPDEETSLHAPSLLWTVQGDARLFGLAAALKAKGFIVTVEQDEL